MHSLSGRERQTFALPVGNRGVVLDEEFKGLPAKSVIKTLFGASVPDAAAFTRWWVRSADRGEAQVGVWRRTSERKWQYEQTFVHITPSGISKLSQWFAQVLEKLDGPTREKALKLAELRDEYRRQAAEILAKGAKGWSPERVVQALASAKAAYERTVGSAEFREVRAAILDAASENYPIAQKVLLRTVEKTIEDPQQLTIDLAKGVLTGGGTVTPIVAGNAMEATLEVLVEEGVMTSEEANLLRAANILIQASRSLSDADTLLEQVDAVRTTYRGLVEVGVIEQDFDAGRITVRLGTGSRQLDLSLLGCIKKTLARNEQSAEAHPREFTNSVGMKFVLIPAGKFMMGSPDGEEDRDDDEQQHRVQITKPYYLGQTEVTQGQWESVMGTKPWEGKRYVKEGSAYAATYVSWDDAQKFCRSLREKDRRTYRLPTEAEWEYACRGGTTTAYHFGDDVSQLDQYAWFNDNAYHVGDKYAHQVGQKRVNALGLYDMHGNVWEWCQDWYDRDYASSSPTDPTGPSSGSSRVLRGGSWLCNAVYCRSEFHLHDSPGYRDYYDGFRVVCELE